MTGADVVGAGAVVFDDVVVELEGVPYRNWETIRIGRELNSGSGTFELRATLTHPFPAKAGVEAKIRLGPHVAATGYVDSLRLELTADGHVLSISGRDRTSDLVDCSAPPELGTLSQVFLDEIATRIAKPYGVEVQTIETGPIFPTFTANQGDTAWAAIERAARLRGKLCYPTADGRLRIDRAGQTRARTSIREGYADLALAWSTLERYRLYVVRGQNRGSDNGWGASVAAVEARVEDSKFTRPRTLVVVAESAVDPATAQERAEWERTVRIARSASITATLRGWRQGTNGPLWELNQLVEVYVSRWRFRDLLLVDGLEFTRGDDGTRTTLRLVRPNAYLREPGNKPDPFDVWADARDPATVEDD